MCDFITPTVMAYMAIASTAVSVYSQQQTAKAQTAQINVQAENERNEIAESAEEELGQRIRASRERRARARVAAGESGALGASFAASINQSLVDQNMDAALVSKKAAFSQRAVDDRSNVALSQIRSPSALEAGLQIAGAGVQGYNAGLSIQSLKTAAPKLGSVAAGSMSPIPAPPPALTVFGNPNS